MIGQVNDETNFPNELLLTNGQVASLCKAFATNLSVNVKLTKTQLSTNSTNDVTPNLKSVFKNPLTSRSIVSNKT